MIEQIQAVSPERAGFTGQVVCPAPSKASTTRRSRLRWKACSQQIDELEGVEVVSPYAETRRARSAPDGTIAFAQLNITDRDQTEFLEFAEEVQALDDPITEGGGAVDGLTIEYGGEVFGEFELPASEAYGLIAAMIILILAFGSVLAMGLPIGTAIVGLATGAALVTLRVATSISMPDFTVQMTAMIGLGVGIDYALFIVQRFREGLQHGLDVDDAIVDAIDTSGRAVMFAGSAVLISLCGMFLMGLAFMNGLAVGAITGVLMMMAGVAHAAAGVPRDRAAADQRDHPGGVDRGDRRSSSARSSACSPSNAVPVPGRHSWPRLVVYAVSFAVPRVAHRRCRTGTRSRTTRRSGTSGRASSSAARGR